MTEIRVSGEPDLVDELCEIITEAVPNIIARRQFESRTPGEIVVYLRVQEPNQVIVNNLQDHQVIRYCRTWRSKSEVSNYFSIKWDAAEEILERLYVSGDLVRELNEEGRKDHHHYEYIDASKVHDCKSCAHYRTKPSRWDPDELVEYCRIMNCPAQKNTTCERFQER